MTFKLSPPWTSLYSLLEPKRHRFPIFLSPSGPTMTIPHYLLAVPSETLKTPSIFPSNPSPPLPLPRPSLCLPRCKPFTLPLLRKTGHRVEANSEGAEASVAADALTSFKHLLLPITDNNPYLSEGSRQAAATTAALAKKYGADITVVVIDERQKESVTGLETLMSSIRWHLAEGGFQEFKLLERLGEGSKPTAIIGEVADDMNLDLVVISMDAIHSKHVDANLLAEFIPCPVMLLPL